MSNIYGAFRFPTMGGMRSWNDWFLYAGWRIQRHIISGRFRLLSPKDVRVLGGSFEECKKVFFDIKKERNIVPKNRELVILMHALGRTHRSMKSMAKRLRKEGVDAYPISYPSTKRRIHEHSYKAGYLLNELVDVDTVHFVTHGFGGIVLRHILARDGEWKKRIKIGRIVMVTPPNQGIQVADDLKNYLPYRMVLGPSAPELTPEYVQKNIPEFPKGTEFAIIAGGKSDDKGYNHSLDGDNDFLIRVDEAKLSGSKAFKVIRATHFTAPQNSQVIEEIVNFIKTGHFSQA
ncbi:MAG: hypothetical protein GY804_12990 [Alphaproteobacteria bacterium]|nr:hypothetical protein [Alphaproteobacteria bacterium]